MALSICSVFSCSKSDNEENGGGESSNLYVDLGLPSGTKWKTTNESNATKAEISFFTFDEAKAQFGNKVPSREQWLELINECEWTWTGTGFEVVGPNGKSISLPGAGCRNCDGEIFTDGNDGNYWSSTENGPDHALYLDFFPDGAYVATLERCNGYSVRLIQD